MKVLVIFGWLLLAGEAFVVVNLLLTRNIGDDAAGRGLATGWGIILGGVLLVAGAAFVWGQFGGPRVLFYLGLLALAAPLGLFVVRYTRRVIEERERRAYWDSVVIFPDPRLVRLAAAIDALDTAQVRAIIAEGGLDFAARHHTGVTILGYAINNALMQGQPPVAVEPVRLLMDAGARPTPDILEAEASGPWAADRLVAQLMGGGEQGPAVLDLVLSAGGNASARDRDGRPLLASSYLRPATAEVLVRHGADVNARDSSRADRLGYTPAMLQAIYGEWDLVAFLLDHGADPALTATDGATLRDLLRAASPGAPDERLTRLRARLGVR